MPAIALFLKQVDRILEETAPCKSSKWVPATTFVCEMAADEIGVLKVEIMEDVERLVGGAVSVVLVRVHAAGKTLLVWESWTAGERSMGICVRSKNIGDWLEGFGVRDSLASQCGSDSALVIFAAVFFHLEAYST